MKRPDLCRPGHGSWDVHLTYGLYLSTIEWFIHHMTGRLIP